MNCLPIHTPRIVPGGLNDCAKFSRRSLVGGGPNCAMNGFAAVSRIDAPQPTANSATRNGPYCPLTAAGQNRTIPAPNRHSPVTMPTLYPQRRISSAAGIAMQKYPVKFAVDTSCALNRDSSNDLRNCCTRMSVRLFDIPHRKNSTRTITNSAICPNGNTATPLLLSVALLPVDVETCIPALPPIQLVWIAPMIPAIPIHPIASPRSAPTTARAE